MVDLLLDLMPLHDETNCRLDDYFAGNPEPPDDDPEFGQICDPLWGLELRIKLAAELAILMSAFAAEERLNMFAVYNVARTIAEPLEKLSPPEKLQVLSAFVDGRDMSGDNLQGTLKKLVAWRNAYAHGHCYDRPVKSLRRNHLVHPADYPGVPSLVGDVARMVGCYVALCDHLASISLNPYTGGGSSETEEIRILLGEIARYVFEGDNTVYNVIRR